VEAIMTKNQTAPKAGPALKKLRIYDRRRPEGGFDCSYLDVGIDDEGNLVMEGVDGGPAVEEFWGDNDYEYWQTVPAAWKDTVLLYLMKERFEGTTPFGKWCEERGIPTEFANWV
jgi:hypothetical protein